MPTMSKFSRKSLLGLSLLAALVQAAPTVWVLPPYQHYSSAVPVSIQILTYVVV